MNQNAGQSLVFYSQSRGLSVHNFKVVGGVIQLEALRCLDFDRIVGAIFQRTENSAVFIGGHSIHQLVIYLADLEGDIRDSFSLFVCIDLDDLHAANGVIVEVQTLYIVCVDHHSLTAGLLMDCVALDGLHLGHDYSSGDPVDLDLAVFVRPVQTVGGKQAAIGVNHLAISIGDFELDTL